MSFDPIRGTLAALAAAAALSLGGLPAGAQTPDQPEGPSLEEQRDAKLAEEWFKSQPWTHDYDKARALAKETGKPIFAYFTRSYAY